MHHQNRKLTQAERDAITAKYQRRLIELGIPIFGLPEEGELAPELGRLPTRTPRNVRLPGSRGARRRRSSSAGLSTRRFSCWRRSRLLPARRRRHIGSRETSIGPRNGYAMTKSISPIRVSIANRSRPRSTRMRRSSGRRSTSAKRWTRWRSRRSTGSCRCWRPSGLSRSMFFMRSNDGPRKIRKGRGRSFSTR